MYLREVPNASAQWPVEQSQLHLSHFKIGKLRLNDETLPFDEDDAVGLCKVQPFLVLKLKPLAREELSRGRKVPAQLSQNPTLKGSAASFRSPAPLWSARQSGLLAEHGPPESIRNPLGEPRIQLLPP